MTLVPFRADPARLFAALDRLTEVAADLRKRRALAAAERRLEAALAKAWRIQGRDFARRFAALQSRFGTTEALREAIGPEDWEALFTEAELATLAVFAEPLTAAARIALTSGARAAIADFAAELTFDLADPEAVAYLERAGAAKVTGINETTRERLRTLLTDARASGWSYDRTAAEIRRTFADFGTPAPQRHIRSRAHLVAVTETGEAYEQARRVMAERLAGSGLTIEKHWLAVGDDRTDDVCLGNDTAGWIALDASFPSGASEPPEHPACRCTTEYRRAAAG